jgi:hypothetical protein
MLSAFCRNAPAVRFIDRTIVLTGDLFLEWLLSSRWSCFVQGRRGARLFFVRPRDTMAASSTGGLYALPLDVTLA